MRLVTWMDVRRVFEHQKRQAEGFAYPPPIRRMEFFMSGVDVVIASERKDEAMQWLKEQAPNWIEDECFLLATGEKLPIVFTDENEVDVSEPHYLPLWQDAALLPQVVASPLPGQLFDAPPPFETPEPRLAAFFSFKGGVGRTTHMLACLSALRALELHKPFRVLLIDGDVEAPGFTYWEDLDEDRVSYVSFLEMIHSSEEPGIEAGIAYFAKELKKTEKSHGLLSWYVLPAFSSELQLLDWPIKPEHLVRSPAGSWSLGSRIRQLAVALEVDLVLVDLRAGLSEMSSALMLDARIERFVVSSLNTQSLEGVKLILGLMRKFTPEVDLDKQNYTDPTVLLSMVHSEFMNSAYHDEAIEALHRAYPETTDSMELKLEIVTTEFAQELLHVKNWQDLFERLPGTNVQKEMHAIASQWLPRERTRDPQPHGLNGMAKQLHDICYRLIFAEYAGTEHLLITQSLRAMALEHTDALPNLVIMGSKGAGKTYTFIQMAAMESWDRYCRFAGGQPEPQVSAKFFPFLEGAHLDGTAKEITCKAREAFQPGWHIESLGDRLKERAQKDLNLTELDWEKFWLEELAGALGVGPTSSVLALHEAVARQCGRVVILIDGLEDALQEVTLELAPQRALRTLLSLPAKLKNIRDVAIGMVIFIRKDLATLAFKQNAGQFTHQYRRFELRWDFKEMLQLIAWLAIKAGVLSTTVEEMVQKGYADLDKLLHPIWGMRMGAPGSREARTSVWVYLALVDYNGNLQARDLVRLLAMATESARNEDRTRMLTPSDIKSALPECSREKIKEAKQEFPLLANISASFEKAKIRRVPFRRIDYALSFEEWSFLRDNGIVSEVDGEYYMPEIYRFGLGFDLTKVARPRVAAFGKKLLGPILKELNT